MHFRTLNTIGITVGICAALVGGSLGRAYAASPYFSGYQALDAAQVQLKKCLAEAWQKERGDQSVTPAEVTLMLKHLVAHGKLSDAPLDANIRACMWNANYVSFD